MLQDCFILKTYLRLLGIAGDILYDGEASGSNGCRKL